MSLHIFATLSPAGRRICYVVPLIAALAACSGGSGGSTGPTYPTIQGNYAATYTGLVTIQGLPDPTEPSPLVGSVTLSSPDNSGNFTGSYIEGNTSGVVAGQVQTDGGIQISEFSNPDQTALQGLLYFSNAYPGCNVALAGYSGMSGTVNGTALQLNASVDMPCTWFVGNVEYDDVPTTFSETIAGNR